MDRMSYLVLARKYRPQTFEDVVAQEHVTKTLQNAVRRDRVGSGYLFCGPRGTGKTTTARILAKALNCAEGPTPTPCGSCSACTEIAAGSSLDVLEIDAASNTGVDDVRTLRENVRYLPTSGQKRIYIIDEVHRLSGSAFDALLKILEEPPGHVVFVLATTEPLKVPETILSRTQRFDFKRVSAADMADNMKRIAEKEGLQVDQAALMLMARKADGSVRDSLSLMDQVAAYAGESINEEHVVDALGLVDRRFLFAFTETLAARDTKKALQLTRDVIEGGVDVADFVQELLEHFRILLVLAADKDIGPNLGFGSEELEEYVRQADYFSLGDIIRLMKATGDINQDLRFGLEERLALQMAATKMSQMEATVRFEEILQRLNQASPAASAVGDLFGDEKKKADRPTLMTVEEAGPPAAGPVSLADSKTINVPVVQAGWQDFLAVLRRTRPMLASQLGMAMVREVRDNAIILSFPSSGATAKQLVEKPDSLSLIVQALREHYKANVTVKFEIDVNRKPETKANARHDENAARAKEIVDKSPRLRKLIERVDGEVIGIRKVE